MIPVEHPDKVRAVLVAHDGWTPVVEGTFAVIPDNTMAHAASYVYWQHRSSMVQVYADPAAVLAVADGEIGQ